MYECKNERNVSVFSLIILGQKKWTNLNLIISFCILLFEGNAPEPDVVIGDVIKKKPEVIDLLGSENELENIGWSNGDEEHKKKHGELTKRLHKRQRTPCK